MMTLMPSLAATLPTQLPEGQGARLLLLAIRRLGTHGLGDAQLVQHFMTACGPGFRRPLIAVRVMVAELAVAATIEIAIGPCCCPRMTAAESALIEVAARVSTELVAARLLLADLLGNRNVEAALTSVELVAAAFADAGLPVTR